MPYGVSMWAGRAGQPQALGRRQWSAVERRQHSNPPPFMKTMTMKIEKNEVSRQITPL